MSGRLKKVIGRLFTKGPPSGYLQQSHDQGGSFGPPYLAADLDKNLEAIFSVLGKGPDLIVRHLEVGPPPKLLRAALLYADGMVDTELLGELFIKPVLHDLPRKLAQRPGSLDVIDVLEKHVVAAPSAKKAKSVPEIVSSVLRGDVVLLVDSHAAALVSSLRGFRSRNVEEPTLETVIRGPKEGFTENLRTNLSLLRRKIVHPGLCFTELFIGRYSQTRVVVAHIAGVAEKSLADEVIRRVSGIDIDGVLDSGYIEQLIEDAPYSLFPTIGNTEKPDVVAARLLEGRVAVLVDGSPVALTVPRLFYETIQTPEDYYSRPYNSSIIRIIRLIFLIASIILPGLYVALINYDPEAIPQKLVFTIAASREGVPFPLVLEVVLFGLIFEGLREAGVRLPRPVGSAVTIVGALIIGTAAVEAGLASSSTVIMTAFVGIASFITPGLTDVYIAARFLLVALAGVLGLFGLVMGMLFLYTHMCSLRSFGVPYMSPIAPSAYPQWKDIFVRAPLWLLKTRPFFITKQSKYRMGQDSKPERPPSGQKERN